MEKYYLGKYLIKSFYAGLDTFVLFELETGREVVTCWDYQTISDFTGYSVERIKEEFWKQRYN